MMQSTLALGLREDHMSGELLKRAIERRGFKKKHVAERKGITPSTLARQLSGKHSLTLRDLREYTEILQCEFEELVVDLLPIPIIGEVYSISLVRMYEQTEKLRSIIPPFTMPSTHVAIEYEQNNSTNLYVFDKKFMELQNVDASCYKQLCVYKMTKAQVEKNKKDYKNFDWSSPVALAYLYPEPNNLYTLNSILAPGTSWNKQELVFAAPIVARWYDPISLGWQYANK
jgi:transcriptional regulator with XRE-family HTH domain